RGTRNTRICAAPGSSVDQHDRAAMPSRRAPARQPGIDEFLRQQVRSASEEEERGMTNVMEGIRILEVAEHTFVPAASAILADWGAEVIKIEHVERGDAMRGLMSSGIAGFGGSVHVLMEHANRGKKSLALDLSDPAGLDLLYQLAARCDVFLTNKMPG